MAENDAAWSPDGRRLAFAREVSGNWDIYVMNGDGSGVMRLTSHAADDRYPAWSPDGARLAFQSDRDGNEEVYILTVAGPAGNEVNWTRHPDDQREPTWSPDGTQIAYTWVRSAGPDPNRGGEIAIMDLSDRTTAYFADTGIHAQPAWRWNLVELTPRAWVPLVRK
jgi:Tol biopolymer transport system component